MARVSGGDHAVSRPAVDGAAGAKCHDKNWGFLAYKRYLLHDGDGKFCPVLREVIQAGKVKPLKLPARCPNLNAFAERWVRSVKEDCLSRLIFFGEQESIGCVAP